MRFPNTTSKEYESTAKDVLFFWERRSGNTTRQIDHAIQIIFSGKICFVRDHYDTRQACEYQFNRILKRLSLEHNLESLISKKYIRIDKNRLEIELLVDSGNHTIKPKRSKFIAFINHYISKLTAQWN